MQVNNHFSDHRLLFGKPGPYGLVSADPDRPKDRLYLILLYYGPGPLIQQQELLRPESHILSGKRVLLPEFASAC